MAQLAATTTSALCGVPLPHAYRSAQLRPVAGLGAAWRALRNLSGAHPANGRVLRRLQGGDVHRIQLRTHDGMPMAVQVQGQGHPVLLVHGLGGSHHDWQRVARQLARHAQVLSFDQRGHGERALQPGTLPEMAADVMQVIDALGLQRPLLVGHSMGALVVMQCLHDHGNARFGGVCIVDQSPRVAAAHDWQLGLFGGLSAQHLGQLIARLRANFVQTLVDELAGCLPACLAARCAGAGWPARWLRHLLQGLHAERLLALLQSLCDCDFRAQLSQLQLPTLVVLGGRSHHYGGLPLAGYYQGALKCGVVRTFARADHSPHRCEPQRFATEVCALLQRVRDSSIHAA